MMPRKYSSSRRKTGCVNIDLDVWQWDREREDLLETSSLRAMSPGSRSAMKTSASVSLLVECQGMGVVDFTVEKNYGIPFGGHLENFLDLGTECGSIYAKIFGLEVIEGTTRFVGDCLISFGHLEKEIRTYQLQQSKSCLFPEGRSRAESIPVLERCQYCTLIRIVSKIPLPWMTSSTPVLRR